MPAFSKSRIVGAVEIGTSKVSVLVGEVSGSRLHVIGLGEFPSRGVVKGVVVDAPAAGEATHRALVAAENSAGARLQQIYLAQSGSHIDGFYHEASVNVAFTDVITAGPFIAANKIRALAVSGSHRFKGLPDVPTVAEAGLPHFVVEGWAGLVAAAGTPPERVKYLNEQVNKALQDPDVIKKVSAIGGEIVGGSPEKFGAFMAAEDKKWGELVDKAHLQVNASK